MKCRVSARDSRTVFEHPTAKPLDGSYYREWEVELSAEEIVEMAMRYSIYNHGVGYECYGLVISKPREESEYDLEVEIYDGYIE